jgi:hypothetical protein
MLSRVSKKKEEKMSKKNKKKNLPHSCPLWMWGNWSFVTAELAEQKKTFLG